METIHGYKIQFEDLRYPVISDGETVDSYCFSAGLLFGAKRRGAAPGYDICIYFGVTEDSNLFYYIHDEDWEGNARYATILPLDDEAHAAHEFKRVGARIGLHHETIDNGIEIMHDTLAAFKRLLACEPQTKSITIH